MESASQENRKTSPCLKIESEAQSFRVPTSVFRPLALHLLASGVLPTKMQAKVSMGWKLAVLTSKASCLARRGLLASFRYRNQGYKVAE